MYDLITNDLMEIMKYDGTGFHEYLKEEIKLLQPKGFMYEFYKSNDDLETCNNVVRVYKALFNEDMDLKGDYGDIRIIDMLIDNYNEWR